MTGFELDHFFVAVSGPETGRARLHDAGFVESAVREHPGQGTASGGVFFENAYLELIWLTDPAEAGSPTIRRTRLLERADPRSGACPFGIGFRHAGDERAADLFTTWDYTPPYVPEGTAIPVARNSENLTEPFLFLLPWRTGPGWDMPGQPNGSRRVTRLSITIQEHPPLSTDLLAVIRSGLVGVTIGNEFLMDVELDGGNAGVATDLHPSIPLRIHR